jgi:hypothetical protein
MSSATEGDKTPKRLPRISTATGGPLPQIDLTQISALEEEGDLQRLKRR